MLKKTLAAMALSAGAAVALIAAAVPNATADVYAYYALCRTDGNLHVCVSNQQHVASLVAVPQAQLNTLHVADAVAYIAVYDVPNSSIGIPCVVASANSTTSDECANLGLVRDPNADPVYLFDGGVDGSTPALAPLPLAVIDVCTGTLNANYNSIGINNQSIVTVCVGTAAPVPPADA